MTILQSIILGIIQGLTEFLPISSSGHLILVPKIFNWPLQGLAYDAMVHLATALAIIFVLRKEIWALFKFIPRNKVTRDPVVSSTNDEILRPDKIGAQDKISGKLILIAIIPAGLVGVIFNNFIEESLRAVEIVAMSLIVWGLVLWLAEYYNDRLKIKTDKLSKVSWKQSLAVGLMQVIALIPGTSRSGITITAGLFSGMTRRNAVKFSFLVGLPLILGAGFFKLVELVNSGVLAEQVPVLLAGFISAFISGLLAIKLLLWLAERANFNIFVIYRIILGLVLLLLYV